MDSQYSSLEKRSSESIERIDERISVQAARIPSKPALIQGNRSITYRDLDRDTCVVANYLRSIGVVQGMVVGILGERSISSITGSIAVLKAGGICLSLEPSDPQDRIERMIEDSALSVVIVDKPYARLLPARIIVVDVDAVLKNGPSCTPVMNQRGLDDVAWIVYTSGSTGTPKGVETIHRSLVARLISGWLPDFQVGDICGLTSSLTVGVTASRLFLPLGLGLTVVIVSDEDVRDVGRFIASIDLHHISSLFMFPSFLREVLRFARINPPVLGGVRAISVTGEPLTVDILSQLEGFAHIQLINMYGSSEIGTTPAMRVVNRNPPAPLRSIGKPVPNNQIHILDEEKRPVSPGAIGELYVTARHLARGYLNRPQLTAEKFIEILSVHGGLERSFRTGDLGRWLPSGEIELLGRVDNQVKIRGVRVEIEEVETVLRTHQALADAVVTVRGPETDRRLVAYIMRKHASCVEQREIREFLGSRLPSQMIPSRFMFLDRFPVTSNGKIDRMALPDPFSEFLNGAN
jgi:amino acid adenylation domain-containing protein